MEGGHKMYYNTNEAAKLLGYTNETIRRKIRKGEISAIKVRDKLQIPRDEIRKYLDIIVKVENVSQEEKERIIDNILTSNNV